MATFEIPNYRLAACTFSLVESVGVSRWRNGTGLGRTETADAIWRVDVSTVRLTHAQRAEWQSWKAKLRGGLDLFSLYDVTRKNPIAYPSATASTDIGSGWDGTATVTSVGASGALGLSGLPSSYVVTPGDYIALEQSGKIDFYQVTNGGTASAGAITATVRPFLRSGLFTTSAVARLWRPKATFAIEPGSWSDTGGVDPSPISFSGIQVI